MLGYCVYREPLRSLMAKVERAEKQLEIWIHLSNRSENHFKMSWENVIFRERENYVPCLPAEGI